MALPSEIADPLPASKAASPLVLLVDDSREQLEPYREHLLAAGFRVATATSGSDGVALAFAAIPDIIVMDLGMPAVDGWEAARILSTDARTSLIPILALSGQLDAAAVMRAMSEGCACFVPKPCLAAELESILRSTLGRYRLSLRVGRP